MARKSRKNLPAPEQRERPGIRVWRAALYIRLSVEFNGKRGDSLETQKQIMEAYLALCPDIEIVEVYTDNGVTGRTFERPAFWRLLSDVDDGKIDCIVVKDLSRLGRNTIDTGYYIEKYFPIHGVRFIAVNDQYDSEARENSNHLIVPLKNMINEAYAADISKKVKAQQRQAMKDGEFVGARPPYGYRKDPDNCHRLLINEETTPVVRQIFQWTADGVPLNTVVKRLNESGVMTPGHYLAHIGLITSKKLMGSGKWQTWTVSKILEDEVYTGDMVQGKHVSIGHKQKPTERADWIVVRDTHEAIISRELYEKAQAMRKQWAAKYTRTAKQPYSENILRGRVFCGHCGKNLHRQRSGDRYFYRCISNDRLGDGACAGDIRYLSEPELFQAILAIIRKKAECIIGNRLRLQQHSDKLEMRKAAADREIAKLRQETEKNRAFLAGLYENFVKGILTRTEYSQMKADYEETISAAVAKVQRLQEDQRTLEEQAERYICLADRLAAVDGNTALSALLVGQVIERITVNSPEDIAIDFRFENEFGRLWEVLKGA